MVSWERLVVLHSAIATTAAGYEAWRLLVDWHMVYLDACEPILACASESASARLCFVAAYGVLT